MKALWILGTIALVSGTVAHAAETWSRSNEDGNFVYAADIGDMGVMIYPIGDTGLRGAMYVEGLAGNRENRGRFTGYWTEPARPGTPACVTSVVDARGLITNYWGRIEVLFTDPRPPSRFVLLYGLCFDDPDTQIVATPVEDD